MEDGLLKLDRPTQRPAQNYPKVKLEMKNNASLLGITLSIVILSFGATAHSAMNGKDFLQASQIYQNGFINGFVRGIYFTCLDHLETKKQICSLDKVLDATFDMASDQVLDVFLTYIRKNIDFQQKEVSELLIYCFKKTADKRTMPK